MEEGGIVSLFTRSSIARGDSHCLDDHQSYLRYSIEMNFEDCSFFTTDWNKIQPTEHLGQSGKAYWRTLQIGTVRIRMVEYTADYVADHWCSRGHVLLVLEGELATELKDGRVFTLSPGMSYQVATDAEPHRSSTPCGAKLFIVD